MQDHDGLINGELPDEDVGLKRDDLFTCIAAPAARSARCLGLGPSLLLMALDC